MPISNFTITNNDFDSVSEITGTSNLSNPPTKGSRPVGTTKKKKVSEKMALKECINAITKYYAKHKTSKQFRKYYTLVRL